MTSGLKLKFHMKYKCKQNFYKIIFNNDPGQKCEKNRKVW